MRVNKDLMIIYPFAIIVSIYAIASFGVTDSFPDTISYISAWDNIVHGQIDKLRTPIYPVYLGLAKVIFGLESFEYYAVIGQYLFFLLSIAPFHSICHRLISNSRIVFWTTVFYAVNPFIFSWSACILTESLAISGIIFLMYFIIRLYDSFSYLRLFAATLLLVALLMLRPAFIYLIPVVLVSWGYLLMKPEKRRQAIAVISSTVFACLVLISYMSAYRQQYGLYATSQVSTVNRWLIARQYGLINPDVIADSAFRADIRESYRLHGERYEGAISDPYCEGMQAEEKFFFNKYDVRTINEVLDASFFSHPFKDMSKAIGRAYKASSKPLFFLYAKLGWMESLSDCLQFRMQHLYFFLTLYFVFLLVIVIRQRYVPWITISMFLFTISNLILVIVGAPEEWNRLVLPSFPISIILFAQLCALFSVKPLKEIELQ